MNNILKDIDEKIKITKKDMKKYPEDKFLIKQLQRLLDRKKELQNIK